MQKQDTFLRKLLLDAGARLRKHHGRVKTIRFKAGAVTNLVTNVDREIEEYIKDRIRKSYPEDSIMAEESRIERAEAPRRWIIDPLDGTTNFAHDFPIFCISIALEIEGTVVLGGVHNPILNELFFARKNGGATLNKRRISVSRVSRLERSMLATGFPYDVHTHPERSLPYFNALIQKAQGLRRNGSAALDLCHLAMGRFDGFFEVQLNPWDTAAGVLILLEAGGKVTDFPGGPYSIYQKQIAASNGHIHEELVSALIDVSPSLDKGGVRGGFLQLKENLPLTPSFKRRGQ